MSTMPNSQFRHSRTWLIVGLTVVIPMGLGLVFLAAGNHLDTSMRRKAVAQELQSAKVNILHNVDVIIAQDRIRLGARSSYSFEKMYSLTVIGELGPKANWALTELIEALKSNDPYVLREAARAAGTFGPSAAAAVPALIQLLRLEGTDASWFAADSLGNMGAAAFDAIPQLRIAAQSTDPNLRESAKASLEKLTGNNSPK